MPPRAQLRRYKVLPIGDSRSGKTCLLSAYAKRQFREEHNRTVFEHYSLLQRLGNRPVRLGLWDTAGKGVGNVLRPLAYRNTDVILLCFSVVSRRSMNSIRARWMAEIRCYCPDVPVILVGTKIDLRNDQDTLRRLEAAQQVPITADEGNTLADAINAVCYMECSAKTNEGLAALFAEATSAAQIHHRRTHKEACCIQ